MNRLVQHLVPSLFLFAAAVPLVLSGCSSSNDAATPSNEDGGTSDGAVATSDAAVTDSSVISTGGAQCSFLLSGGETYPTMDAVGGCGNNFIEGLDEHGDYTTSIGGGFTAPSGDLVTVACTISSPTAPVAGAVWKLMADDHHNGNCMLDIIRNKKAILYGAEQSGSTTIAGSATITFASASVIPPVNHPKTINYAYDVTIDATLPSQPAGGADAVMHGHFVQTKLPIGG